MSERIALVTGANKGIGREVVRQLARLGMTVYLGSRDAARGRAAAQAMHEDGDIRPVTLDVTDETSIRAALQIIEADCGRLDVLVNNAGVALDGGDALAADPEKILQTFATNVHGPARIIQLALPLLRKSPAGRIVNVASAAGSLGRLSNDFGYQMPYAYCASKVALNAVTLLFALALRAEGIKVQSVNPGLVNTDLSHHMGTRTPAEGAAVVVEIATQDGPSGAFLGDAGTVPW
jgi:NAD(P)-dependent dehydrogenase (short-subunit alcohol dehydrogenase family)